MSTQPEALRLAALLDDPVNSKIYLAPYIAAELRRLHALNQELLEALKDMLDNHEDACTGYGEGATDKARTAIAKATGEKA
jgi:hypothetical protein